MAILSLIELSEKHGRILVVGDHYQLPPIINRKYNIPESGLNLYDSIFKLIYDGDVNKEHTCQLTENFRMNQKLSNYSARMIYGKDYTAFNNEIGKRKIKLKGKVEAGILH